MSSGKKVYYCRGGCRKTHDHSFICAECLRREQIMWNKRYKKKVEEDMKKRGVL